MLEDGVVRLLQEGVVEVEVDLRRSLVTETLHEVVGSSSLTRSAC